ncbi:FecR protein [Planctomycetes bacterium CA13]|uniref:FecR protein n=1 Tax=Novipirellula herctigrandis TaxID=2527986 RepID=A0A5C5YYT6_9BACT|nr:FecR protein [Planctomycetes bacterium CA13]
MTSEPNPKLSSAELDRLIELASAYREDRIGDAEVAELDMMLSESPAALDAFVEIGMLVADLSQAQNVGPANSDNHSHLHNDAAPRSSIRFVSVVVLAASLLLAVGLWSWLSNRPAPSFARLESVSNCLWRETATPARVGGRIGVGHFRLAEGVATIRFDNGAQVDLEGSSHLEVLGQDHCQLHSGKLVVTVENDFKGFTVDTPHGQFIDQGTSFGVTVEDDGASVVEVFDGFVDVKHRTSGQQRRLAEDAAVRLLPKEMVDEAEYEPPPTVEDSGDVQIASTAAQGADCSLRRDHQHRKVKSPLLVARTSRPALSRFDTRICLRFDLTNVRTADANKASLQLTATPSGKGFASQSTDTVIAAYGIIDDTLDHWLPDKVLWNELPGVIDNPWQSNSVRLLGHFTIPKGQQSGNFRVEGPELTKLLKNDSNGLLSIVLVSETESRKGMMVNAFASSHHDSLRPPTLHLWLAR